MTRIDLVVLLTPPSAQKQELTAQDICRDIEDRLRQELESDYGGHLNIPIVIHTTITKLWKAKHRDAGQHYQAAIAISRGDHQSFSNSGFSSEPAKVVYVNASGSRDCGAVLLSRRVDHVFAEWRYTDLASRRPSAARKKGDDTPTIEFVDCDFETERHAVVLLSECEIFSALRATSRYDREVKPAIQLLSQPNAKVRDICKSIVQQAQAFATKSNRAPLLSCLVAFVNSPSATYLQNLAVPSRYRQPFY